MGKLIQRELTNTDLEQAARRIRQKCIELGNSAGSFGAHYGPALSLVEIMTYLYGSQLRFDADDRSCTDRDRLILSKGHGSLALYSALGEFGYIDAEMLATTEKDGSRLPGQPLRNLDFGIEFSSGSLGMGLGFGVGLALSARMQRSEREIFVVMGDGETNEGSVWEAALSAAHYSLSNLTAVIDINNLQSDGPTQEIMAIDHSAIWEGFGWEVVECANGHSITELQSAFSVKSSPKPKVILAKTVKGKGVSFMEDSIDWHHGVITESQLTIALAEINESVKAQK